MNVTNGCVFRHPFLFTVGFVMLHSIEKCIKFTNSTFTISLSSLQQNKLSLVNVCCANLFIMNEGTQKHDKIISVLQENERK
jgi:hypothetical protein